MWADLISSYGYWILAIGCLLEGETVLLLAGFAARSGRLDPLAVFVIAAVCGFAGDEIAYWIGRRHGGWLLARWPLLARRSRRVRALLERRHALAIVMLRFAYGLRLAGPVVIGMTDVPCLRLKELSDADKRAYILAEAVRAPARRRGVVLRLVAAGHDQHRKLALGITKLGGDAFEKAAAGKRREDENRLLYALLHHPSESYSGLASLCGWTDAKGTAQRWKVGKVAERLAENKLVHRYRERWILTAAGKEEAEAIR